MIIAGTIWFLGRWRWGLGYHYYYTRARRNWSNWSHCYESQNVKYILWVYGDMIQCSGVWWMIEAGLDTPKITHNDKFGKVKKIILYFLLTITLPHWHFVADCVNIIRTRLQLKYLCYSPLVKSLYPMS